MKDNKTPNINITSGTGKTPEPNADSVDNKPRAINPQTSSVSGDKKPKKTVEVDAEILRKLVDTVESQKQDIDDLKQAADIGRLNRIQAARNQGKLVKSAKVNTWEGKIVVGWFKVKDDVFFDEAGKLHEDQQIKLVVLDKNEEGDEAPIETSAMSYRTFSRICQKVEGEVIKESKNQDGQIEFTVHLPDGREVTLPIKFLN